MANVQQAPNMFQGQNPDLYAEQLDLQRRQQFADMLRQQSMAQNDPNRIAAGGRTVKFSPLEGLTKMLTAGLGSYVQDQNDKKQIDLTAAMAKRRADALKSLAPAGVFDAAQPVEGQAIQSAAQQTGQVGPTNEAAALLSQYKDNPQSAPGAVAPNIKKAWINALTMYESNPELGGKLIQNLSELTNNQKDWAAQGLDPAVVGKAELGKLKAGGLVNVAPNNTVLDANTNKPVFAAPDFNSGRQNTFGPNGQPQMSRIAGSEIIPKMAGEVAQAQEAAKAGLDMVIVNTLDGPVMKTRQQAVQQAGAQPQGQPPPQQAPQGAQTPNMGFPAGTQMPAMTGSATPENRIATLQQERQQMVARNATPADLQMIDREIASVSRAGAPAMSASNAGSGSIGIPLQSDEAKAFGSSVAKGAGEDLLKGRDKAKGAADDLFGINESRKAIASGAFLGSGADFKTDFAKAAKGWLGVDIDPNKVTNSEYLRSTLGQRMLDNAKKLGVNPTDADARRLDTIIGTIAKDPKALTKAMDFQEEMAVRAIKQHNNSVQDAEKRGLKSPYDLTVQLPSFQSAQQPTIPGIPNMAAIQAEIARRRGGK